MKNMKSRLTATVISGALFLLIRPFSAVAERTYTYPQADFIDENGVCYQFIDEYTAKVREHGMAGGFMPDGTIVLPYVLSGNPDARGDITILSEVEGRTVVEIPGYAFYFNDNVTSVVVPDTVTVIDERAFADCSNLKNAVIPGSITKMGWYVFNNCKNLENITLGEGLELIPLEMFSGCSSLTEVTLPSTLTSIGQRAFLFCSNLTEITIPDKVTVIRPETFRDCINIETVVFPDNSMELWEHAFVNCPKLKSVYIPKNIIFNEEATTYFEEIKTPATFGWLYGNSNGYITERVDGFTIKGYKGSDAENYAVTNGFNFIVCGLKGDVNGDGVINIADLILLSKVLAGTAKLNHQQTENADIDGNGVIDVNDCLLLAQYLSMFIDTFD